MTTPQLTIVMATYNAASVVERTISSIAAQQAFDPTNIELILMDGNSTDETVHLARSYEIFHEIVSEPDAGVYDAMNNGAERASGRWIQFLNAGDTFADDSSLTKILGALDDAEKAGQKWLVAGARNLSAGGAVIRSIPHDWLKHALGIQPHCHQSTLFDRQALIGMGSHSLAFGTAGDFDVVLRFGFAAGAPAQLSAIVINYEGGGMSDVGPRETAKLLGSVRRYRLDLRGALGGADRGVAWMVGSVNAARVRLGRIRGKRGHARRRSAAIR